MKTDFRIGKDTKTSYGSCLRVEQVMEEACIFITERDGTIVNANEGKRLRLLVNFRTYNGRKKD